MMMMTNFPLQASSDTAGEGPAAGMQQAPVRASGMADMGPAAGDLPGLGGTPLEAQPLPPVAPPAESLKILQACAKYGPSLVSNWISKAHVL